MRMVRPTVEQLRANYEMLRSLPPFSRWEMPPVERVEFVLKGIRRRRHKGDKPLRGQCVYLGRKRWRVYVAPHRELYGVVATLAHEMVHIHEDVAKLPWSTRRGRYIHGPSFQRAADEVCRELGFPRACF